MNKIHAFEGLDQEPPRPRSNGAAWRAPRELEYIFARDMRPQLESSSLVKGILDREQISLLFGSRGCGKTFLAIDRDLSIAAGLSSWFGHNVRPGAVVYLAIEAGRRIIQNRVSAWLQAHDMVGQDIPFVAVTSPVDLCHLQVGDVPLLISTIQQRIRFEHIALLEIDTISRALAGGDENAPQDMGALVHAIDQLRSALRCHVSGIHHVGKSAGRGARGHSLLPSAVDTEIEVARSDGAAVSSFAIKRQRDGLAGERHYFELPVVELGPDPEDSDRVTSCTVKEAPAAAIAEPEDRPVAVRLAPHESIALRQLANAIATAGKPVAASNHGGNGQHGVSVDLWREYSYSNGFGEGDKPDTRKHKFQRTQNKLTEAGLVGCWQGQVWLPG